MCDSSLPGMWSPRNGRTTSFHLLVFPAASFVSICGWKMKKSFLQQISNSKRPGEIQHDSTQTFYLVLGLTGRTTRKSSCTIETAADKQRLPARPLNGSHATRPTYVVPGARGDLRPCPNSSRKPMARSRVMHETALQLYGLTEAAPGKNRRRLHAGLQKNCISPQCLTLA